jgi:eukaryotic-like serine/threonine-protein kinase
MASPGYRPQKIRFEPFELDVADRTLRKRGHTVRLQPQHFDVLMTLVENAGRVVSREEIRERIWETDTFVDFQRSINFAINQIRAALNDNPERPSFIETVPKRGYRFIAEIDTDGIGTPDPPTRPILVDRRPMASGISQSGGALHELEEPIAQIQPVAEAAPVQSAPSSRKAVGILIAGAVVIAAFVVIWWARNRPAAPLHFKEQQLTHNSNDNPISSVSISPDGKYFAYSDLGGLHVKLLETGEIHDYPQPAELGQSRARWVLSWLPDSAHFLATAWGVGVPRSTWKASVLSQSLQLLRKDSVTWSVSPDGSQFAFTTTNENEIWLAGIGSGSLQKVAAAGGNNWFSYVEWSPDGSHLLYLKRVPTGNEVQNLMEVEDIKSGRTITLLSGGGLHSLTWLHDGRILYVQHDPASKEEACQYWIARVDSAFAKFSSPPRQLPRGDGACITSISATFDGKRVYFLKQTEHFGIYVADLDVDATRISPPRHLSLTDDREFPAAWTADSRDIIFVSRREGKWGFYRESLASQTVTPILTDIKTMGLGAVFPRLTPDGAWLVYAPLAADYVDGVPVDLLRVSVSGGSPQQITKTPLYDIPRCSRAPATLCAIETIDKDQLIFTAFDPMHGRGHELARLKIDDPEKFYGFALSPDGTTIAVLERGGSTIQFLNLRTHDNRKITVKGWSGLAGLDFTADGKGLFTASRASGAVLLKTDFQGNARVLWEPKGDGMPWAIPSPDGRHVAMPGYAFSSNIWSMQDF